MVRSTDERRRGPRVEIVEGDATRIRGLPALVVPANKQLTLGWGSHLAEEIQRKAGSGVEEEALAAHPEGVELGEAVVTSAGEMEGYEHLIHAAILDKWDLNPLFLFRLKERTSRETLARAVRASLVRAEESALAGMVLTPMGAGIGGMRDEVCAKVILDTIEAFTRENPDCGIRRLVIACLGKRTARIFRHALRARQGATRRHTLGRARRPETRFPSNPPARGGVRFRL